MTAYMLDTNICSYLIKRKDVELLKVVESKLSTHNSICISAMTYAELRLGSRSKKAPERLPALIDELVERLDAVIDIDTQSIDAAESIYAHLQSVGTPIGFNDAVIAGCALAYRCVLVTHNTKEFSRIPDLPCEDWVH